MLTPSELAEQPKVLNVVVPDYDFEKQSRTDGMTTMAYTGGSVQTFNSQGKPNDSKSDQND